MGQIRCELNVGQFCGERFGDGAALIGFGTHRGKVACASEWDGQMEVKEVKPSSPDSIERLCHDSGKGTFLLERGVALAEVLRTPRPERYIGVIYRPETERLSHYMASSLSRQFDVFVWFDKTSLVIPLAEPEKEFGKVPDTFPFGV